MTGESIGEVICDPGYRPSTDTPDTLLCDGDGEWAPPVTCDGKNINTCIADQMRLIRLLQ